MRLLILNLLGTCVLAAPLLGASIELTWDKHPDLDVTGYVAYWGTTASLGDSMDVGMTERAQLDGLPDGATHYFAVRAYDRSRNLGPMSQVLVFKAGSTALDSRPKGLSFPRAAFHPNPFSGRLNVSMAPGTSVSIFTLQGRMVKTFEPTGPGKTVVSWNATDQKNRPLTPGLYLAKMKTGKKTTTQKLFLVR